MSLTKMTTSQVGGMSICLCIECIKFTMASFLCTGEYLGEAVNILRDVLTARGLQGSNIVAPDVSQMRPFHLKLMKETITNSYGNLNATSFHNYYGNSRNMTWKDFIDPVRLDSLASKIKKAHNVIRQTKYKGML